MPILTTKLTIPAKTGRLVARPRLNRAFHHKLTLVSAPAGFGKTTLLKVWLEAADGQAAWLSLDAADNTLVRFWTYVIAALQQVKNDLGAETLEILTRTVAPPAVEALLTPLLNELAALPFFLILALDDFHLIEAPEIHESLQFFLEHQPPTVHVILATRKDPMLPLSKMRARREVVEVRAGDLRFTEAEAVEFIQDIMGICLSPEAFHALEARTEGWAAGLQMAALSMLHHTDYEEFIAAFTGSHRYIMDYLMDEVLNQQPSEIRPFLLQTSILNRLSGALCDAVVDGKPTDSQQILQNLEYSNLFLVSLDDRREWYRYHSLFADLLRHHLAHSGMDIAGLHLRASEWYEQQGYIEEALRHALQAEDTTRAVRLVEQNHLQRTLKNEWNIRADWLRLLPAEIVATRPRLLLLESWLLMAQFKMEAMLAKHEQIRSLLPDLPEEDIPHLQAEIDIMASTVAIWQGAPAQS
ncbi:MAG: hypothetical protein K8I82_21520, partial [Anaerolineae bacterium]|nr:hypothetical protein [Anaerolineae bacterium]